MSKPTTSRKAGQILAEREARKAARVRSDFAAVLATEAGRRILWHIIDAECGVNTCTFTGNSQGFFAEGRRSVGLKLQSAIASTQRGLFLKMVEEDLAEKEAEAEFHASVMAKHPTKEDENDDASDE